MISNVCKMLIDPFGHQVFQKLMYYSQMNISQGFWMRHSTTYSVLNALWRFTWIYTFDIIFMFIWYEPINYMSFILCILVWDNITHTIQDLMWWFGSKEQISRFKIILCHNVLHLTKITYVKTWPFNNVLIH